MCLHPASGSLGRLIVFHCFSFAFHTSCPPSNYGYMCPSLNLFCS
jgi:hypothetical protein